MWPCSRLLMSLICLWNWNLTGFSASCRLNSSELVLRCQEKGCGIKKIGRFLLGVWISVFSQILCWCHLKLAHSWRFQMFGSILQVGLCILSGLAPEDAIGCKVLAVNISTHLWRIAPNDAAIVFYGNTQLLCILRSWCVVDLSISGIMSSLQKNRCVVDKAEFVKIFLLLSERNWF